MDKIFGWIGDLFTKLWSLVKKILPYVMLALAIYFTFGGSLVLLGMTLSGYGAAIAAVGISFLVAPEETVDVATGVAEDVGTAAGSIIGAAAGGLSSSLFGGNGVLVAIAVAVGVWWLLSGDEPEKLNQERAEPKTDDVVVGSISDEQLVGGGSVR